MLSSTLHTARNFLNTQLRDLLLRYNGEALRRTLQPFVRLSLKARGCLPSNFTIQSCLVPFNILTSRVTQGPIVSGEGPSALWKLSFLLCPTTCKRQIFQCFNLARHRMRTIRRLSGPASRNLCIIRTHSESQYVCT